MFTQTAITLASAVVISSFVALSLSPMLASKFLRKNMKKSKMVVKFENFLGEYFSPKFCEFLKSSNFRQFLSPDGRFISFFASATHDDVVGSGVFVFNINSKRNVRLSLGTNASVAIGSASNAITVSDSRASQAAFDWGARYGMEIDPRNQMPAYVALSLLL